MQINEFDGVMKFDPIDFVDAPIVKEQVLGFFDLSLLINPFHFNIVSNQIQSQLDQFQCILVTQVAEDGINIKLAFGGHQLVPLEYHDSCSYDGQNLSLMHMMIYFGALKSDHSIKDVEDLLGIQVTDEDELHHRKHHTESIAAYLLISVLGYLPKVMHQFVLSLSHQIFKQYGDRQDTVRVG